MPWKETCAVEQRMAFVREVLAGDLSKAALCRLYGISRPTGDKWLERFTLMGQAGLNDLSTAPHVHPNQIAEELADVLLDLRRQHMTWGPRKLLAHLERHWSRRDWPAASTVGELIRRNGLSTGRKRRHRAAPRTAPFSECDGPNRVWCIDFKGWFRTGSGARCYPLTLTDAYSRYLLRCQGLPRADSDRSWSVMEAAFREYGLPQAIRSDNGSPFATVGLGGLSRLSVRWLKLGIVPERIDPGRPDQNGRHERMHRTLKAECPPEPTMRRQQASFDRFGHEYNYDRPHEALGQRVPAELYVPSPRRYPARIPEVEYPETMEVRQVKRNGEIKWRGKAFFVTQALAGEPVGLEPIGDGTWKLHFVSQALGVVDERAGRVWTLERARLRGLIPPTGEAGAAAEDGG